MSDVASRPLPPAPAPPAIAEPTTRPQPASTSPESARTGSAPAAAGGTAPLGNAATLRSLPPPAPGSISLATETLQVPDQPATEEDSPRTIPVHLGGYARGELIVVRKGGLLHTRPAPQYVPLIHPALERLRAAGVEPLIEVTVRDSKVSGRATLGRGSERDGLAAIRRHADKLGWLGVDLKSFDTVENTLTPAGLRFVVRDAGFDIGSLLDGALTFGLDGEAVIFDGRATLRISGQQADVRVGRDAAGGLAISGDMQLTLGKASANVHAELDSTGRFDVRGTGAYRADKFSGEITVVVADKSVAESLARAQLGVEEADKQAVDGGPAAPAEAVKTKPTATQPVVAGWGTLQFAISEWLAGSAKVVIDHQGELTVIGDITPPAEVTLFDQRDHIRPLFKIEGRAVYGVPVIGNVFVFANIGMEALAKLGPGKLHGIRLSGTYSTRPDVARGFSVSGTLTISAFAGLRLRAEGGAGLTVLDHDIKVGVGVNGLAGVRGYVEAVPTIGMREAGEPATRKTEFFLKGHLEIAAQPFLALSGDLFVELDSPWWSPAPDKKWTWPIGALEYPLPGQFGIGADLDYVLGSGKLPDITFGEVGFDSSKFITDLVNDHVPPKKTPEQEKAGTWKEGEAGGEAPGKGAAVTEGGAAEAPAVGSGGAGGKDESGTPAPKTAVPGTQPTGHPAQDGHEAVPAPEVQKRWAEGMKELGELTARAEKDPLDQGEVTAALNALRKRHGFTDLHAERRGASWHVNASMNPSTTREIRAVIAEAQSTEGTGIVRDETQDTGVRVAEGFEAHIVAGMERHHAFFRMLQGAIAEASGRGRTPSGRLVSQRELIELSTDTHRALHELWDTLSDPKHPSAAWMAGLARGRGASRRVAQLIKDNKVSPQQIIEGLLNFYDVVLRDYPDEKEAAKRQVRRIADSFAP
ncbi:hypothetical protein [Actinoplanes sp. NPDC023714]|uniref:hypothetical protein n=1 Tax=Actinoplanes sp. NPDC023714 TaxID=3154322 RepID=UPI0033F04325